MVLDKNYRIETDDNNFILKYENKYLGTDKDGKEKEVTQKDEFYFPKLSYALGKYMNECLKPSSRVEEVLSELKRIELLISKL